MIAMLEQHRAALEELCRSHRVRLLEVFGSATTGKFNPDSSDLDFLVEFQPMSPGDHGKAYFGMLFGLEDLFQRKIDLVETTAISNPYFLRSVNQQRTMIYAA